MPNPPRIAIALPGIHRVVRGAETALEQIGLELAKLGASVTIFGSGPVREGMPYQYCQVPCIDRARFLKWPRLPLFRSHYVWEELTFAVGLLEKFDPSQFDITIGCSYPFMNWILRRGGVKHVFITQNGDWMVQARNAEYRLFSCDGLVCTNPQYFARNQNRFRAVLIPNGVDAEIFKSGKGNRVQFGLPENVPIVLMVSALIPSKHVKEAIAPVAAVKDGYLVVAGDGECREEVEREAERLLPGRFKRMTLPREQMPELYRCADVLLHMSQDEPSANAYMEALASGLPIVTHDWEVTRWTLEDCGVLVDTNDSSAVTSAITRATDLRSDSDVNRRRDLVARRFTWSSIGGEYLEFLKLVFASTNSVHDAETLDDVGLVIIGRNEGDRLVRCLKSGAGKTATMVYVDSGSTDNSVNEARSFGAQIVDLDPNQKFTAARARNAGVQKLREIAPQVSFVQFVDGDCEIQDGWLTMAANRLRAVSKLAVVCGRRRERFPDASIYNRLCDIEWNTRIGPAKSCGGDAMMRLDAFSQGNGFNPDLIAGEEPELCVRIRKCGWNIERINAEMTLHDAAMTRFSQWWKRAMRAGHAYAEGNHLHGAPPERFNSKQVRSIVFWGIILPFVAIAGLLLGILHPLFLVIPELALLGYLVLLLRVQWNRIGEGLGLSDAFLYARFTVLGKLAQAIGVKKFYLGRSRGKPSALIEYKAAPATQDAA